MSRSVGRDASGAGQSVGCSVAIVSRNDFDCVHEVASKSLAIDSRRTVPVAFPGTKNDKLLSRKALEAPALTQSVVALQHAFATQFSR